MPKTDMLRELKQVAIDLGRIPERDEWRSKKLGKFSADQIVREFGGWKIAITAAGLKEEKEVKKKFSFQQKKLDSFTIYEIDLEEAFIKAGNPKSLKVLAQPDTHAQYHDPKAWSVFLQVAKKYKPHIHVIMGDFLDAEGLSHWPSNDLEPRRFVPEVKIARQLLDEIEAATPGANRVFLTGNHEEWISQAMAQRLPELFDGLDELGLVPNLTALLELDRRGYQLFPVNHFIRIGKANFTHGLYTTDNHPKRHLDVVKDNIYYGHLHDTKGYNTASMNGPMEAQSLGCLCRLDAKFMKGKPNNWVHAFGIFEFFRDGTYTFICPKIINGKMSLWGEVYEWKNGKTSPA